MTVLILVFNSFVFGIFGKYREINNRLTKLNFCLVSLIVLGQTSEVSANRVADQNRGFYRQNSQGWFWYQSLPESLEEDNEEEIILDNMNPLSPETSANTEPKKTLTAAWFRENMQHYMDIAIDTPTPENVKAYLYLQRIMMDKSSHFSDMSQQIVMGDPNLDEVNRRPLAPFASQAMDKIAAEHTSRVLKTIATHSGLFFFFRSDCPYCHAQAPILESLSHQFGMTIFPISLDGRPLESGQFPNYRTDQGQAETLNVQSVPALFLLGQDDTLLPIAQGTVSFEELTRRVLLAAKQARLISPEDYNQTLPVYSQPYQADLSKKKLIGSEQFNSAELIEYLRENYFNEINHNPELNDN
ncbi:conjugal transfer protein TraF [Thorsellia anophelis]|uniref:Conjugal transfer pilus assembly protein TraF n=1 Tax=Thorsellia anophelis DSM 18579 TaxID=1123402 RepID=A0A1I0D143_9GAMM|nr:conjugal transfer protein TraF [Thorsellia anophelis]SET25627.1 conjugal transfer pilus assembly protein TraF [Thorsellia anophelis DSM 18579]